MLTHTMAMGGCSIDMVTKGGLRTFAAVANVGTDFHKADLCIVWANGKSANSG